MKLFPLSGVLWSDQSSNHELNSLKQHVVMVTSFHFKKRFEKFTEVNLKMDLLIMMTV